MKKYLIILLLWLLSSPCFSQQMEARMLLGVGGGAAPAGPLTCTAYIAGGGLFCEDFEGATACGDGSNSNCQITYTTISNATFTASATTYNMHGIYCLSLTGAGNALVPSAFTATDPIFFLMKVREHTDSSAYSMFFSLYAGVTQAMNLYFHTGGGYTVEAGGGGNTSSDGTISVDTSYWIRGSYTKGASSTAKASRYCDIAQSTCPGGVSGWDAYITANGNVNASVTGYGFWGASAGSDPTYIDNVKFSTTEFTNAPTTY